MVLPTDTRLLPQSPFVVTKTSCDETLVNRGSREELDGRVMHSVDGCQQDDRRQGARHCPIGVF